MNNVSTFSQINGSIILIEPHFGPLNLTLAKERELAGWTAFSLIVSYLASFIDALLIVVTWPRRGSSPSSINFLIFHYVAVSFIINFAGMPTLIYMIQATENGLTLPATICDYTHSSLNVFGGVVNWCDAGMAVNRCIALLFPFHYKGKVTKIINYTMMIFPWFLCLGLNLLISLRAVGSFLLTELGFCYTQSAGIAKYFNVFMSYIPFGIVGVSAVLILVKNYRMRRIRVTAQQDGGAFARLYLRRLRMAKILLFAIFLSVFCSVSGWASIYFTTLFRDDKVTYLWLRTLWATQFSIPPVFLFVLNSEYRAKLAEIFRGRIAPYLRPARESTDPDAIGNTGPCLIRTHFVICLFIYALITPTLANRASRNELQQSTRLSSGKPDFLLLKRLIALHRASLQQPTDQITETNLVPTDTDEQNGLLSERGRAIAARETTTDMTTLSNLGDEVFEEDVSSNGDALRISSSRHEQVTTISTTSTQASTTLSVREKEQAANTSVIAKVRSLLSSALPRLQRILEQNNSAASEHQRGELLRLAAQIQPLLQPLAAANPNYTLQINALGTGLAAYNRTARGWGGSSCCCCGGGGGGGDNSLLPYLLMNNNNDSALNTLLPLLFGLIALLIMKLPT
ncbi:hypothetical protein BV898_13353 [Hypsibius exemplaris]|uniref:G-protein coupled receptors family 1 profile domain-containing protein n=1 Tax=Hypsibius exemplaris TaxID=2072580 RepID=A0A1W0WB27_HYPEX|nr:hypothetical protein BV898_13353 [Hypsibius exemplaris]